MKHFKFDTEKYPFDALVGDLYEFSLHTLNDSQDHSKGDLAMDTDSQWHNIFYNKLREGWPEFISLYEEFIKNEIFSLFVEEDNLIYQKTPSFRVSQPEGKAIYVPHCDGDDLHKHPPGEINVFMPLTKAWGNNSMFLESLPGLGDYKPITGEFGDIFLFYGNRQRHFNKFNDTGQTRCSFDFRVIPPCNYDESYNKGSATMNSKFIVGEYYNIMGK